MVGNPLAGIFLVLIAVASLHAFKDIVIERPKHLDVDFADLLLEYNPSIPPELEKPVEIAVDLKPLYASYDHNLLSLTLLLNQTWTDLRLSMAGSLTIPVPTKYASIIWKPNTHFINDVSERSASFKVLHLRKDGRVTMEQKLGVKIPCLMEYRDIERGATNCSLDMEAFGWRDHVHYWLQAVDQSKSTEPVMQFMVEDLKHGNATSMLSFPVSVNTGVNKDVLQYMVKDKREK
ncbi:hypothetical protein L596_028755 [Steinernema carpocapsae]|uniref:Neurotransmitter-gated ion-channel ligand-binding domain-containing protein n=1 Tax=Steinernema carpocapsae TaxID=34508 RepID=A0A4U5LZA7_STECR|nr:hypothetical protein L596_028755 [Steinernema carpocapsae]